MLDSDGTYFLAAFSGQIETVQFPGSSDDDELFFRYDVVSGPDWELISGTDGGLSQTASQGHRSDDVAFNMPYDASYKSTSPFGWPQLVISVYGVNSWGVEAVRGYGRIHLPLSAGVRQATLPLLAPRPATQLGEISSWIFGRTPELINPKILAEGTDSYLLRTRSYGHVKVTMNLITKGLKTIGYDNVPGLEQ